MSDTPIVDRALDQMAQSPTGDGVIVTARQLERMCAEFSESAQTLVNSIMCEVNEIGRGNIDAEPLALLDKMSAALARWQAMKEQK